MKFYMEFFIFSSIFSHIDFFSDVLIESYCLLWLLRISVDFFFNFTGSIKRFIIKRRYQTSREQLYERTKTVPKKAGELLRYVCPEFGGSGSVRGGPLPPPVLQRVSEVRISPGPAASKVFPVAQITRTLPVVNFT